MADIEFIVPGSGIVNDTEEDFEPIVPGFGIYNEQEPVISVVGHMPKIPTMPTMPVRRV